MSTPNEFEFKVLPSGDSGVLLEFDSLADVLALYTAMAVDRPQGVIDLVPAARTLMLHIDPAVNSVAAVVLAARRIRPRGEVRVSGSTIEVPTIYDGDDLESVGKLTGWGADGVIRRHTAEEWTVAFCGFAPGFAYMVSQSGNWDVPRRSSPRTKVPQGAVALAGEFASVYPRESPGGWQLIGTTDFAVFDLECDPPTLFAPGTKVRFLDIGSRW